MEITLLLLGVAFAGFLLGSIPNGYLITRFAGVGDIRQLGSGNIGATNVLRTGRKSLAILTLLGDVGKGVLAVYLGRWLNTYWTLSLPNDLALLNLLPFISGIMALLGHIYTPWLGFKGGKGVATAAGVLLGLLPLIAGLVIASWLVVLLLSRYSSLAALTAALLLPVYTYFLYQADPLLHTQTVMFSCLITLLILNRHRDNVARLLAGTEHKIQLSKNKPA